MNFGSSENSHKNGQTLGVQSFSGNFFCDCCLVGIFRLAGIFGKAILTGSSCHCWLPAFYQMNRLSDFEEDNLNYPEDAKSALENRRIILFISISSFLGTLTLGLLYSSVVGITLISSLLLLGYLYSFPTIRSNPRLRIKDIFIGKKTWHRPSAGLQRLVCTRL